MTKGGRRLRFRAGVVVGDKKGKVGFGISKGADVAQAVEKATRLAKKNIISVPIVNETISHPVEAKFGAAKIILKPQTKGRGLVAGGTARVICSLAGIKNISSKKIKTVVTSLTLIFIFSIFFVAKVDGSVRRNAVVVAVEKVSPAVINISTIVRERVNPLFPFSRDNFFRDFFPDLFSREYTRTSLGSGVIIDGSNGYIVTNHRAVFYTTQRQTKVVIAYRVIEDIEIFR